MQEYQIYGNHRKDHVFSQIKEVPGPSKPSHVDEILKRRLLVYKAQHSDMKLRSACDIILQALEKVELRRLSPHMLFKEARALQEVIALKMGGDERDAWVILEEVKELLAKDGIF